MILSQTLHTVLLLSYFALSPRLTLGAPNATSPQDELDQPIEITSAEVIFRPVMNITQVMLDTGYEAKSASDAQPSNNTENKVQRRQVVGNTDGSILVPATEPWTCLQDPNFPTKYAQRPGFNGYHFRVAGLRPYPTNSVSQSTSPATTNRRVGANLVELRPPLRVWLRKVNFPPNTMPALRVPHIAAHIERLADTRFYAFYLLSPHVLSRISTSMQVTALLRTSARREEAVNRFRETFNLQLDSHLDPDLSHSEMIRRPAPPRDFVDLMNDPELNGEGTHDDIGLITHYLLIISPEDLHPIFIRVDRLDRYLLSDVLMYMTKTEAQYRTVVQRFATYFGQQQQQIIGFARPRNILSKMFEQEANAHYSNVLSLLKRRVDAHTAQYTAEQAAAWAGRVQARVLRFPEDWKWVNHSREQTTDTTVSSQRRPWASYLRSLLGASATPDP